MKVSAVELAERRLRDKKLKGQRRWKKAPWRSGWNGLLLLSYLVIGVGVWWLLMIFGPVARAEAVYQWKSSLDQAHQSDLSWAKKLLPRINFELLPAEIVNEMGLVIPKLYIEEKIIEDVDPTNKLTYMPALKLGIAQAEGSNDPGEGGLGYYFAHSSGLDAPLHGGRAVFYLLNKLEPGDEVRIYKNGERFSYKVVDKWVTEANDLGFLHQEYNNETIVLQTCWPVGTSRNRLLVKAERV
jgi:LPXTG-site transpeptidase (sortase) family protein